VLIEQGDTSVPFFVVVTGEVEIVRATEDEDVIHNKWSGKDWRWLMKNGAIQR
jgi:CRP-like cAMP-binding protein